MMEKRGDINENTPCGGLAAEKNEAEKIAEKTAEFFKNQLKKNACEKKAYYHDTSVDDNTTTE